MYEQPQILKKATNLKNCKLSMHESILQTKILKYNIV